MIACGILIYSSSNIKWDLFWIFSLENNSLSWFASSFSMALKQRESDHFCIASFFHIWACMFKLLELLLLCEIKRRFENKAIRQSTVYLFESKLHHYLLSQKYRICTKGGCYFKPGTQTLYNKLSLYFWIDLQFTRKKALILLRWARYRAIYEINKCTLL